MLCWRFTDIHNTKYLQHDIPLVCRVCSHLSTIVLLYVATYPSTYHYVNERRGTHAYVMTRSITFMNFRCRKWKILNLKKNIFGPRNVHGKGHFHLRSAAFVYVRAYSHQRRSFFLLRQFCCGYIKIPYI